MPLKASIKHPLTINAFVNYDFSMRTLLLLLFSSTAFADPNPRTCEPEQEYAKNARANAQDNLNNVRALRNDPVNALYLKSNTIQGMNLREQIAGIMAQRAELLDGAVGALKQCRKDLKALRSMAPLTPEQETEIVAFAASADSLSDIVERFHVPILVVWRLQNGIPVPRE